jgi:hypothetical protein
LNELEQVLFKSVLPNGELDSTNILKRQQLYTGRNGRVIERFWVDMNGLSESFIFKPLTNGITCGREKWIYEHLLGLVPLRFPKLHAVASHEDPLRYWGIYEDLGKMSHHLKDNDYIGAAASIPFWHCISLDTVPSHFNGDKPDIYKMIDEISDQYHDLEVRLLALGLDKEKLVAVQRETEQLKDSFETEIVISHGDYHQGNICKRDDELIIIDWEFVHHNSVFWDLYCLLDMSHPDFPKMVSSATRLAALQAYANQRSVLGWESKVESFIMDYHRYTIIHSVWMLGLIEKDLQKAQWEVSKLLRAQQETLQSLTDCLIFCSAV